MVAEIKIIHPLCTPQVTFYTLKFDDKPKSEFEDFYDRLSSNPLNKKELDLLLAVIDEIGERGSLPRCVVLNKGIVFLLNGDRKKTFKATQQGSNVSKHFYMANSLHKLLMQDRLSGFVTWDENSLSYEDGYCINVHG